ncbi:MAG: molybdenum cofactor biosynthesis protein MoaE [Bordetella sp.]|nr:molybdenum cofactor biosynthesis protein MoaE [Bordetella sp.]
MPLDVELATRPFRPGDLMESFIRGRPLDGAVVSFIGLARGQGRDGDAVRRLQLDWYPGMTERSMLAIADAAQERFEVSDILVRHRCGELSPEEPIVLVAVASPHRRQAFLAADYVMDRLKTEAAFWKREHKAGGATWVEPSASDRADLARWS